MRHTLLKLGAVAMIALGVVACSGDDGAQGPAGPSGPPGATGPAGPTGPTGPGPSTGNGAATGDLTGAVTGVSIAANTGVVTVTFTMNDAQGRPVAGAQNFEFTIAKLMPANDQRPAFWQSYINNSAQPRSGSPGARVLHAVGERGVATEVQPGVYRYTFCTPLASAATLVYYGRTTDRTGLCPTAVVGDVGVLDSAAAQAVLPTLDLAFNPNATTRVAIASRDNPPTGRAFYNVVQDFVPAQLPTLATTLANQVVTNQSCGACHALDSADRGRLALGVHGNFRFDVNLCSNCHNAKFYDTSTSTNSNWVVLDMLTLAHKLHNSEAQPYIAGGVDYSEVTYPQNNPFGGTAVTGVPGVVNCRTCHNNQNPLITQPANRPATDTTAWATRPTQQACNTCHNVNFDSHFSLQPQPGNALCSTCHGPDGIAPVGLAHATPFVTPNNPELPAGVRSVEYDIASVTVNASNQPIVRFRILVGGTPINLKALPFTFSGGGADTSVAIGGVNMRLAWSAPMPAPASPANGIAIAMPLDWNNFGVTVNQRTYFNLSTSLARAAYDQPSSVNLSTTGVLAALTGPDANGYFTTAPGINPASPLAFPTGTTLTLRGVFIESTLAFTITQNGASRTLNLGGNAVLKGIEGATSTLRRQIVDINACNTCHERVGFHGNAGRVNNPDQCATCHNPEMSSSNVFAGFTGPDNLFFSQLPNNFKEMIHGIHASAVRLINPPTEVPYNFIRGNSAATTGGQGLHPFQEVTYPARNADCLACHKAGTFATPNNIRYAWTVTDAAPALGATAAAFNPSLSERQGPATGACGSCHNSASAQAHMATNTSFTQGLETCSVCHAPGQFADPAIYHDRLR